MKKTLTTIILAGFFALVVGPLVWSLISSFKTGGEILASPWALPSQPQMNNYATAWEKANFSDYFLRSVLITIATMAILLPIGAMSAYVLAKYRFRGSGAIYGGFLFGMMFPNLLAAVPLFLICRQMNLTNTYHGLVIVYVAYSLSFTIFVLHGFFSALPDELMEAATLDGCSHFKVFQRVMFPLAKPGLIVAGLFNAIGIWNEYNLAKLLLQKDHYTLPLGLASLTSQQMYRADWGALFAGLVISMVPIFVLYWMFKDKIQQGMLAGAIK